MGETSKDWWTSIRTTAFFAAGEQAEAAPEAVDPAAIELTDWGQRRAEMGLGGFDSDFIGIDDGAGLPDWRQRPIEQPEAEQTALGQYAATERAAAGIKTASAVFGASQPQPRRNPSPWSV
jgi:hypothetical protein